jgi:hypothetical protein
VSKSASANPTLQLSSSWTYLLLPEREIMKKVSQSERQKMILAQDHLSHEDLAELASFKKLRDLTFQPGMIFSSGGFGEFKTHKALRFLSLKKSTISEDDFRAICSIPHLQRVNAEGCSVRDFHLTAIPDDTNVTEFFLARTGITNRGLALLGRLGNIQVLILDHTRINDAGLPALAQLKQLWWLSLIGTEVTDEGIMHLASLPHLTSLATRLTSVSTEGMDRFFLTQQGVLARQKAKPEPIPAAQTSDFDEPAAALKAFWDIMNTWEKSCLDLAERERREGWSRETSQVFWDQLREEAENLFQQHCTEKRRVYGAPSFRPYGSPAEHEHSEIIAWQPRDKNRVYALVRRMGIFYRRYLLVRKKGKWLMDHCSAWTSGRWTPGYL